MTLIPARERVLRGVLSAAGFPFALSQLLTAKLQLRSVKQPGRLIPICGGRSLHAVVMGKPADGTPTVILEAGMGGSSLDWSLVQPAIAEHAAVLAYDRAGFGWSSRQIGRADAASYAADLEQLLDKLELRPPYLLVGFSYGGMIARLFASRHPGEIAGIVLADAVHESRYSGYDRDEQRRKTASYHIRRHRLGYLLSPLGLPRLIRQPVGSKRLPPAIQRQSSALGYRSGAYEAAYAELLAATDSAEQLAAAPPLPSGTPLIVLSAGKQGGEWQAMQRRLLDLSDRSEQRIAADSWHAIPIHAPGAVIQAVCDLLPKKRVTLTPSAGSSSEPAPGRSR